MSRPIRSTTIALAVLLGAAALAAPAPAQDLGDQQAAAEQLQAAVAAESARIATTRDGLADARARLATLQARVDERQADLERTREDLVRARVRLTKLQRREAAATKTLSDNLVASYKTGQPDLVTVVFSSTGFGDLFERIEFLKRSAQSNGRLLDDTREARADVAAETRRLEQLRIRFSAMAREAIADRNKADVIENALLNREAAQLAQLSRSNARLATVRAQHPHDPAPPGRGGARARGVRVAPRTTPRRRRRRATRPASSAASSRPRTRSPRRPTCGAAGTAAPAAATTARARSATRWRPAGCSRARSTRPAS